MGGVKVCDPAVRTPSLKSGDVGEVEGSQAVPIFSLLSQLISPENLNVPVLHP